jgi:transcriptional regulator with XRE-family HTH domain
MRRDPHLLALGRAVELIRQRRRMSRDALASATGIAVEQIDALERGQFDPTYHDLLAIAEGLGMEDPSGLVAIADEIRE